MTRKDLDAVLRHAVVLGALAVLLVPGARGSSELIGWWPLWLLGMPLAAWWSLRGFPVPQLALRMPRRRPAQARRWRARRAAPPVQAVRRA